MVRNSLFVVDTRRTILSSPRYQTLLQLPLLSNLSSFPQFAGFFRCGTLMILVPVAASFSLVEEDFEISLPWQAQMTHTIIAIANTVDRNRYFRSDLAIPITQLQTNMVTVM
jgi:hypothetical protein